jgi:hypothetical protein
MSEVRLNIIAIEHAIHGTIHGSVADALVAALSAEPETIAELEAALQRFIKPIDDSRPFASFHAGANEVAWDAGIVIVDMAARIVAAESSYSAPQFEGELQYHDGTAATDVSLIYRVPSDWLFVYSLDEYKSVRDKRAAQRAGARPFDVREVLYGPAMIEFIVSACAAVGPSAASVTPVRAFENPQSEDPIAEIHARWLMTPRADLHGQSPRDGMLAKLEFIDFDLHTRELQWSLLGEGPPPLPPDSFAYRFGGFGSHEYVLYYYLMRHLLSECWQQVQSKESIEIAAQSSRLKKERESWLNSSQRELNGRIPSEIIENERRRIPMVMSVKSMLLDDNCELCQMLAGETCDELGPAFWHLDGCNMDEGFVFSFHRTREEWEEEELRYQQHYEEFERKWAEEHGTGM